MEQSGVEILLQSLLKKRDVLDQLIELGQRQEEMLKQEDLDMDGLNALLEEQGNLVEQLDRLDQGFELVYDRCRDQIMGHKDLYQKEIRAIQECIQEITAKISTINACNMRNKVAAEGHFRREKQEISQNVSKTKVARNYYNSMNKLNYVSPQFYDSKK